MKIIEMLNELYQTTEVGSSFYFIDLKIEDRILLVLQTIKELYGIKSSYSEEFDLFVLNYDQIKSQPFKFEEIIKECRSLVIHFNKELNQFEVVSRAFDRFFNYGESDKDYEVQTLVAREKMDGSLVSIFYWKDQWLFRTKSMIQPVSCLHGTIGTTWDGLITPLIPYSFLDEKVSEGSLTVNDTVICEIISPENKIVVDYNESALVLLAVRENDTGDYYTQEQLSELLTGFELLFRIPLEESFDSWGEALENASNLPFLQEGYVFYDENNTPVMKCKSKQYLAAHYLRCDAGLTTKSILNLIVESEVDEYISAFPEDEKVINQYVTAIKDLDNIITERYNNIYRSFGDRKEFASMVYQFEKDKAYFYFGMHDGSTFDSLFWRLPVKCRVEILNEYFNEQNKQD